MLTHAHTVPAIPRTLPDLPLQPPELRAALLESLGAIGNEDNILVLGRDGPDLMCALIRVGARNVTHLCSFERLEADSVSMVIVPQLRSLDWLESAGSSIRHALVDNGRLVVCVDPLFATQIRVRRMLTLHGFTAIRVKPAAGCQVLSAELPASDLCRSNGGSH